ncbi:hypothetical protein G9463_15000 [Haloarcula sp. JP-Z28]|uniref:DUF7383 domain-containing protein n=1 Tax=Haloarcula sp. JP-Z28 TaxID=2716715 RepID=UPI001404FB8D|nr:hypothetical protein [Haloarcula sp. JP-Z28]NHN64595.1 hypothetical protein [Haloarcula sp. JP-Z28]
MSRRANYALCEFQQHLGPAADSLDVPWAEYTGNSTDPVSFNIPASSSADPYVEMQVFDVEDFNHEIVVNGEPLSGFDIAPGEGWQLWMDTIAPERLHLGENTIQFRRNTDSKDAFVVGSVTVHWTEPVE